MAMKAVVKYVISGDSLVLRPGRPTPGQPPKERVLHLADISAPRMATSTREGEPWAFESREFLRALVVGKEVTFSSIHALPASTTNTDADGVSSQRDLGTAEINGVDITSELLKQGWVRMKESKRAEPTEEDTRRKELENEAKSAGRGIWNPHGPVQRTVQFMMPTDGAAFIMEWKGKSVDAIVEQVRDGSTVRVRLLLPDNVHQFANISLAGVRCPRLSSKPDEPSEQWGEDAKFFTESRLLQRAVKVQLLSLPTPGASPFHPSASTAPTSTATIFIGQVIHPAGNVAEHLVANGLARIVDWHAGILASSGTMERLRAAERVAKEKRACLYASAPSTAGNGKANEDGSSSAGGAGGAGGGGHQPYEALVVRVWSGEQLSVVPKEGPNVGKEGRIYLSSTRAPKVSDPKQAFYAVEARETLRKKLIGKIVRVQVDFVRPKEGEYDQRECATVRVGPHNHMINVAEMLIEKGLATVVRHRRDDEDRSPEYDKLMAAEQAAIEGTRGLHSGKEIPAPKPPINLSESASRANFHLSGFKRLGRVPAVVDYVASGSRFKILLPKDNQSLTLVLDGIRAPRTARNKGEKSEPYGTESAEFASHRYMQRDVHVEFDAVDKQGGFIGALYFNKTENAAVTLVKEGLAHVHGYSADALAWGKQLYEAEAEAKQNKRNIWSDFDPEQERLNQEAEQQASDPQALTTEYLDVIISDVRTRNGFSFSVQVLNTQGIKSLETLMREFSLFHKTASAPHDFTPKSGDLVSAKFSDGSWYRAKVRRSSPLKKEAEVTFIDYGNQDTIGYKDIRPLDPRFRALPGQAQDARLSFIKLPDPETDYFQEAVDRFRSLCEGRKIVANVDFREGPILHLRLMDPSDPNSIDRTASVNADLLREGLAAIDKKGCKYLKVYAGVVKSLQEAVVEAKKERLGMFEYGDVEEDDD